MLTLTDFKQAMSRLAAAVTIVTTDGATGPQGFTASAVCSLSDAPPSLLVCINQSARAHPHFLANQILAVNVLAGDQTHLSAVFASTRNAQERFAEGQWTPGTLGVPLLTGALVNFECTIKEVNAFGTHDVLLCEIRTIHQGAGRDGLVYFNRSYHTVS